MTIYLLPSNQFTNKVLLIMQFKNIYLLLISDFNNVSCNNIIELLEFKLWTSNDDSSSYKCLLVSCYYSKDIDHINSKHFTIT